MVEILDMKHLMELACNSHLNRLQILHNRELLVIVRPVVYLHQQQGNKGSYNSLSPPTGKDILADWPAADFSFFKADLFELVTIK